MANYNKIILVGRLTRDPQLSYLPSNTPVTEFGMAINRKWRGQDGEMREETCFADCRVYGKSAETFNQYMSKGQPVLVEGRLQYQSWTAKDGTKRSRHMVIVETFQFLGGRDAGAGQGAPSAPARSAAPAASPEAAGDPGPPDGPPPPSESDIPF